LLVRIAFCVFIAADNPIEIESDGEAENDSDDNDYDGNDGNDDHNDSIEIESDTENDSDDNDNDGSDDHIDDRITNIVDYLDIVINMLRDLKEMLRRMQHN